MKKIIAFLLFTYMCYCVDYGMDVSVWQGTINWNTVKTTGIKFAIARASVKIIIKILIFYKSMGYQLIHNLQIIGKA